MSMGILDVSFVKTQNASKTNELLHAG